MPEDGGGSSSRRSSCRRGVSPDPRRPWRRFAPRGMPGHCIRPCLPQRPPPRRAWRSVSRPSGWTARRESESRRPRRQTQRPPSGSPVSCVALTYPSLLSEIRHQHRPDPERHNPTPTRVFPDREVRLQQNGGEHQRCGKRARASRKRSDRLAPRRRRRPASFDRTG